jgi:hypothetical protein
MCAADTFSPDGCLLLLLREVDLLEREFVGTPVSFYVRICVTSYVCASERLA